MIKGIAKAALTQVASQLGPHRISGQRSSLWIMMYHRILPKEDARYSLEEPGMIVEPDTFHMHLKLLKQQFDVLRFDEWVALNQQGSALPKRCCVITFDDGWHDNYEFALPFLKQEKVPATLFAVVDKIGTDFQFWPNIVSLLLTSETAQSLAVEPVFANAFSQIGTPSNKPNREYIAAIIHHLKQHEDHVLYSMLERLGWRTRVSFSTPRALMNWDEIRVMENSGLIDIGCHTATHQRLNAQLTQDALYKEIVESRDVLTTQCKKPANLFCFPNGDYNEAALTLVKNHYDAAVTTQRGIVRLRHDKHQLTRIGLHQHISATPTQLRARLSGWL